VVFSMASPMDEEGYFALGLAADYTMAAVAKARAVVLEVNPHVPTPFGNCRVHISQVSALVESDDPVMEVGLPSIGLVQQAIGHYVADMIDDGSTLQIGYGGIPDAVVMQLTHKHDLGIHTEMIGDGILSLVECGAVTNRRKNYLPNKMVATFALGSRKLYQYMHRNPALEMHPVNFTNDPALAGLNDNLVAINATLQIDLLGQCGSESLGPAPYSGTGGQTDFVRAANRSHGGKAFIVLPSTAKGDAISRIVPTLTPGTHVSTSKNDVNYVVTEYGVAQLRGKSAKERARELISIAHPAFRAELTEQSHRTRRMGRAQRPPSTCSERNGDREKPDCPRRALRFDLMNPGRADVHPTPGYMPQLDGLRAIAVASAAGRADRRRSGLAGISCLDLERAVRTEGHAEDYHREAQRRGRRGPGRSGGARALRRGRAGNPAARAADAGGARRAQQGRHREVVADHQGGEYQARIKRLNPP